MRTHHTDIASWEHRSISTGSALSLPPVSLAPPSAAGDEIDDGYVDGGVGIQAPDEVQVIVLSNKGVVEHDPRLEKRDDMGHIGWVGHCVVPAREESCRDCELRDVVQRGGGLVG